LLDEDLYNQSSQDRYAPPEIATASNYSVNNSGTNGILRPPKSNRVQPETAVPLKLKLEIQEKNDLKEVGDSIYRKSKNNRKLVAKL